MNKKDKLQTVKTADLEKKLLQQQVAFNFLSPFEGNLEDVVIAFNKLLGNPQGVINKNYDDTVPYDIPRLIFNYDNLTINIAKSRLDIITKNNYDIHSLMDVISYILDSVGLKWIGYIKTFFINSTGEEIVNLLKTNIKTGALREGNIMISINDKLNKGIECFNIEELHYGDIVIVKNEEKEQLKGLIIKKDINTRPHNLKLTNNFNKTINELLLEIEEKLNIFTLIR